MIHSDFDLRVRHSTQHGTFRHHSCDQGLRAVAVGGATQVLQWRGSARLGGRLGGSTRRLLARLGVRSATWLVGGSARQLRVARRLRSAAGGPTQRRAAARRRRTARWLCRSAARRGAAARRGSSVPRGAAARRRGGAVVRWRGGSAQRRGGVAPWRRRCGAAQRRGGSACRLGAARRLSDAARRGAARRGAGRRGATRHDTTRQRPTAGGRRRQRQRRSGWTAGQRRTVAAACGLWDVGRMWFLFVLFLKKTGFCTIEAGILGQDRLTYCAAFSNLGVGVSRWCW